MYSTPRPGLVTSRIPEQLDALKAEFESLAHDVNMYKMQRDDYDRKLQAQLGELNSIQQTLYDLERNHTKLKQQYEEEIMRLRRQVEMQASSPVQQQNSSPPGIGGSTPSSLANPNLTSQPASRLPVGDPKTKGFEPPRAASNTSNNGPSPLEKGNIGGSGNAAAPNSMFYGGLAPLDSKRGGYQSQPGAASTGATNPVPAASNPTPKRAREDQFYQSTQQPAANFPSLSTEPTSQAQKQHKIESSEGKEPDEKKGSGSKEEPRKTSPTEETASSAGVDWIVGYNPSVATNLSVDLLHNFDHSSVVCCVRFSNDGKSLATGCNKSAQIFDVETGEKIYSFSEDAAKDGDLYIRSVCFSPDNKYLAAGAEDKTVKVWDIEHKRIHHTFVGHELDIYSLDFSRNGNLIVSGSGDKKAKIWDIEKGECVFTLGNDEIGPHDGVTSVAFSPDGRYVAAGSLDRIVRLWDATTGYFVERFEGHLDSVYSVAFSPDGKTLASGSLDKTLKLWDVQGPRSRTRCRSTFAGHKDFVLSVAFSPDGNWLISGSKDRSVQFWDPRNAITHMMLQGHKNSVISVAVSPSGSHFATGSGDFRARIWKM